jgi:hypothetical protein
MVAPDILTAAKLVDKSVSNKVSSKVMWRDKLMVELKVDELVESLELYSDGTMDLEVVVLMDKR